MDKSQLASRAIVAAAFSAGAIGMTMRLDAGDSGVSRAARPVILRAAGPTPLQSVPADGATAVPAVLVQDATGEENQPIVRQTQYQATPPAGSGSGSVNAELQRLFNESGQEMPSMRQQDLPYAMTPQTQMIRPSQPKKQNMLQRFVNRLRGRSSSVPEESQPVNPPAAAYGPTAPQTPQIARQPSAMPPSRAMTPAVRPQQYPNAPVMTQSPSAPMQPRVTAQVQAPRPAAPRTGPTTVTNQGGEFVQPGSAPAFLPQTPASAVSRVVQEPAAAPPQPKAIRATVAAPATRIEEPDDEFVSPFTEPAGDVDSPELLDLDALIERNAEPPQVDRLPVLAPAATVSSQPQATVPVEDADAAPETFADPFTGVELNATDLNTVAEDQSQADDLDEANFGSMLPLAPPAELDDLPTLELPPVDAEELHPEQSPALFRTAVASRTTPSSQAFRQVSQPKETQPKETQSNELSERDKQRAMIAAREGLTGFKGFCPVELRDNRELRDADNGIRATFGLQEYNFSSERARRMFEANPTRYAPAAGGSDVVLLVNAGEEQPGSLDHAVWFRDRIYMFRSAETMALFVSDPTRYADQY